jgi:cyclopropane fatty-acyl-phospholipid synthase-like methyltransferase
MAFKNGGDLISLLGGILLSFICYPQVRSMIPYLFSTCSGNSIDQRKRSKSTSYTNLEKQKVSNFYAKKWEVITELMPDKFHSHIGGIAATKKYLNKLNLKSSDTLLDIGCGFGGVLILASQITSCNGLGYDLVPNRITEAEQTAKALGLDKKLIFFNEDFLSDRVSASKLFDAAISLDVMMHVKDKDKFISKISNFLRKHGRVLIADYFSETELPKHGIHIFDDPAMHRPSNIFYFQTIFRELGFRDEWTEDLTSMALDETSKLIDAIENSRPTLSSKYSDQHISEVLQKLNEWLDHLSNKQISYRAFLMQKI